MAGADCGSQRVVMSPTVPQCSRSPPIRARLQPARTNQRPGGTGRLPPANPAPLRCVSSPPSKLIILISWQSIMLVSPHLTITNIFCFLKVHFPHDHHRHHRHLPPLSLPNFLTTAGYGPATILSSETFFCLLNGRV